MAGRWRCHRLIKTIQACRQGRGNRCVNVARWIRQSPFNATGDRPNQAGPIIIAIAFPHRRPCSARGARTAGQSLVAVDRRRKNGAQCICVMKQSGHKAVTPRTQSKRIECVREYRLAMLIGQTQMKVQTAARRIDKWV